MFSWLGWFFTSRKNKAQSLKTAWVYAWAGVNTSMHMHIHMQLHVHVCLQGPQSLALCVSKMWKTYYDFWKERSCHLNNNRRRSNLVKKLRETLTWDRSKSLSRFSTSRKVFMIIVVWSLFLACSQFHQHFMSSFCIDILV